jgi:hypothetical protein
MFYGIFSSALLRLTRLCHAITAELITQKCIFKDTVQSYIGD